MSGALSVLIGNNAAAAGGSFTSWDSSKKATLVDLTNSNLTATRHSGADNYTNVLGLAAIRRGNIILK